MRSVNMGVVNHTQIDIVGKQEKWTKGMEMRFPGGKTFLMLAFLASACMQGQSEAFQEGNLKCLKNFRAIDKTVCSLVIFAQYSVVTIKLSWK